MKHLFKIGALGMLALGMTACSSDEPIGNGVAQQDEVRYLRVNLVNPQGTRATEFEAGTAAENAINSVIMDFYDAAGNFVVRATPNDIEWKDNTGTPVPNVGEIGSAIVKIGINKEQNLPAYVMCYLNPVDWGTAPSSVNMVDLRKETRESFQNGNKNFAMNNSCYYGTDKITSQEKVKISGTPIAETELYTSQAAAEEGTAAVVDIYVERYAAKVNFTAETEKQTGTYTEGGKGIYAYNGTTPVVNGDITTNVAYSLNFNAEAWTINADAPSMYAVKNFAVTANSGVPSFDDIQTYLGGWTTWNDDVNFRSYWSCSPAFFADQFPQVSDQIVDIAKAGTTGAGEVVAPYALKYYSYNQICGANGNGVKDFSSTGADGGTLPVKYALENTMGKPAFASLNPKAAVPSVLLVGNYSITYNGEQISANTSFYLFNNSLYFETAPTGVTDAVLMKDKFIKDQEILYIKNADNTYSLLTSTNAGAALNNLTVKHPDKSVRDKNLVPQRFVTLQLIAAPAGVYYRPNGAGDYVPVTADNLDFVNTLLWQQSGVAYSYKQGKCYFSMPIWHLGMTENLTNSPLNADGTIDWKKLRPGDMGLVRNHVYKLNVDAITGLATGIENLDYPIIPPMDQDEYWIKYRINILNWRIVPAQEGIIL